MNRFLQFLFAFLVVPFFVFGQSFTFTTDSLVHHGPPVHFFEIHIELHNTSSQTLNLNIIRTENNLPNSNWFSSLCNLPYVCYPFNVNMFTIPDLSVGAPALEPDSSADIALDVVTDLVPATAYITIRAENQSDPNDFVELSFTVSTQPTALYEGDLPVSGAFQLHKNFPNPFNPSTTIPFEIGGGKAVNVQLNVYNLLGEKIAVLVDEKLTPGSYKATWNALDQFGNKTPSGVYFYELLAGEYRQIHKMLLVK